MDTVHKRVKSQQKKELQRVQEYLQDIETDKFWE